MIFGVQSPCCSGKSIWFEYAKILSARRFFFGDFLSLFRRLILPNKGKLISDSEFSALFKTKLLILKQFSEFSSNYWFWPNNYSIFVKATTDLFLEWNISGVVSTLSKFSVSILVWLSFFKLGYFLSGSSFTC